MHPSVFCGVLLISMYVVFLLAFTYRPKGIEVSSIWHYSDISSEYNISHVDVLYKDEILVWSSRAFTEFMTSMYINKLSMTRNDEQMIM